jgi:PKD domain
MKRLRPSTAARTAFVVALLTTVVGVAPAGALVHPALLLDGPSNAILDVDGVAMAPDGTGGLVYRKQVEGVPHVFVVPFGDGRWGAPIEVDREDPYGAGEPAIAAGENGRLLVVWVQARNVSSRDVTEYALVSASLQPGASGFGQAIIVDPNVGEPYTGDVSAVAPRLAMAPDGAAYVVYRAILDDCGLGDEANPARASCRPGTSDKVVAVRAARFNYLTWSSLGEINRAPQIAMLGPTAANAPSIAIALSGNGVVAWQEPDAGGVARIWVRRLFGAVRGSVLQASPQTVEGHQVSSTADAPAVAVGPFGNAEIVFRMLGAPGTTLPTSRIYVNSIFSEVDPHGSQLRGAELVPGSIGENLGPPSDAIDADGDYRLSWTAGGMARALEGTTRSMGSAFELGSASGLAPTAINPAGGGSSAWEAPASDAPYMQVREDYGHGAFQAARLAGGVAGPVAGGALAGDGEGDALIGFTQGPIGDAEVLGAFAQAPPAPFVPSAPDGWQRKGSVMVSWEQTFDAVAGVTYTVYVDGRTRVKGLTSLSTRLRTSALGDGVHRVQVLATDDTGQQTMSARSELKVDTNPPIVRLALADHRRAVRVTVLDRASGVATHATWIAFGDGSHARGRTTVRHLYGQAGLYKLEARVRDRAGNRATVHLRVRVA